MKKTTVIRILTLAIMASMLMTSCGGETAATLPNRTRKRQRKRQRTSHTRMR